MGFYVKYNGRFCGFLCKKQRNFYLKISVKGFWFNTFKQKKNLLSCGGPVPVPTFHHSLDGNHRRKTGLSKNIEKFEHLLDWNYLPTLSIRSPLPLGKKRLGSQEWEFGLVMLMLNTRVLQASPQRSPLCHPLFKCSQRNKKRILINKDKYSSQMSLHWVGSFP